MAAGTSSNKPAPKELKRAPQPKPNAMEKMIQDVTNRYRVTAREARDIVTAVSTAGKAIAGKSNIVDQGAAKKMAAKNVIKQVKETAQAATTGKKGTTSEKIKPGIGNAPGMQGSKGEGYFKGKQR